MTSQTAKVETNGLKAEPRFPTKSVERMRDIDARTKLRHVAAVVFACGSFCCSLGGQEVTQFQIKQPSGVVRFSERIMSPDKAAGENLIFNPTVITVGERLAMIYRENAKGPTESRFQVAFSDDGRRFVPDPVNPVMIPDQPFDQNGCEDPRLVSIQRGLLSDVRWQHGEP